MRSAPPGGRPAWTAWRSSLAGRTCHSAMPASTLVLAAEGLPPEETSWGSAARQLSILVACIRLVAKRATRLSMAVIQGLLVEQRIVLAFCCSSVCLHSELEPNAMAERLLLEGWLGAEKANACEVISKRRHPPLLW